jgi:uncharacterized protein
MITSIGITMLALYSIIVATLFFNENRVIYFPKKEITQTPKSIHLDYSDADFQTVDGVNISGWYIPAAQEKGALLFCHGNAGNMSDTLEHIRVLHEMDLSLLVFDYRGYGRSEGKPTEEGTYLDAEAAWDHLIRLGKHPGKVIVHGQSLGGAVAAEVALRKKPAALVIESTFTSIPDLGERNYPWLPVKMMARIRYPTKDKIGLITCPKLIIHSPDDKIIPYDHGTALYRIASAPKYFLKIRGGHNDGFIISNKTYTDGLKTFLDAYLETK